MKTITERLVLVCAARLFSLLGWLALAVMVTAIAFQSIWIREWDWDEPLYGSTVARWRYFGTELPVLSGIRVPKWIHAVICSAGVELRGFADVSERACVEQVVPVRERAGDGASLFNLVPARTRVAPLKPDSSPRLELCATVLLFSAFRRLLGVSARWCRWLACRGSAFGCWVKVGTTGQRRSPPSNWKRPAWAGSGLPKRYTLEGRSGRHVGIGTHSGPAA